ncbi:MAG: DNA mismatch repair protein MutS [Chitinophagaceae bacterium]
MQIDKITYNDISVFSQDEEFSIFHHLNFTRTSIGKEWLKYFFSEPYSDIQQILGTQKVIKAFEKHVGQLPGDISNGTILVMNKFFDYDLDTPPAKPGPIDSIIYKTFHQGDYSILKFSLRHFADFFRGIKKLAGLLLQEDLPPSSKIYIERIGQLLKNQVIQKLADSNKEHSFSLTQALQYGHHIYFPGRPAILEMMEIFGRLDAWYSMAVAVKKYNLSFPEFIEQEAPLVEAKGLYHILIRNPVPYDLQMSPQHNFLFLTGANMAGKSTLIKSVGSAVFLAHIGMGVPATNMKLTLFDGLLSNINVVDNIAKGESFFFNEVQRIKNTIEKINNGKKWLVLIDELFKGTNVQDAMKCSLTVIKGLIKIKNSLFILSTHLYEIGDELKTFPNITFRYFETKVNDEQLEFSYQLREGISNDRIGYVILKREKVVDMLEKL